MAEALVEPKAGKLSCPRLDYVDHKTASIHSLRYLVDDHRLILHCGFHERCSRSKMCSVGSRKGSGYPMGLLGAWGEDAVGLSRQDHMDLPSAGFSRARRRKARAALHLLDGSAFFFGKEAAKAKDSDDSEPEVIV